MPSDILIKNATVITQNEKREILPNADILITDNSISQAGKGISERAELILDAKGKIAIPGLINMHTHVAMSTLRGIGEGLLLHDWLMKKIWPAEAKMEEKDVYESSLLGICEMLKSGTTCFNDMFLKHAGEIAKACGHAGIRATVSRGMFDLLPKRTLKSEFADSEKFVSGWQGKSQLVSPAVACHAPYSCSEELLVKAKESADKKKLKFHMHVSETRKEVFDILKEKGKYPIEYLDSIGILDKNTILAHASWVTKKEISIISKKKATIVNCPVSSLKLATGGICPVREYHAQGANTCVGTDGPASNNSLNMLESMKFCSLLQRHHYWKADALPAQAVLDFATINGAKALGINAGSIETGKLADIVLLEKSANLMPLHDVVSNIVYSANPSNVSDVIINGRVVVQNREVLTVDEKKFTG